jgi:hypothetical protein
MGYRKGIGNQYVGDSIDRYRFGHFCPHLLDNPTHYVLLFFVQHALQGWCPPIPAFRALGVRTRPEIDREKYAIKALRGDFQNIHLSPEQPEIAFEAAKKI